MGGCFRTGDGANDSNALKAADVGLSISSREQKQADFTEEEQTVAAAPSIAAPFSTRLHHIGAVRTVLSEGRVALVTSFSLFKFMFEYGLIQFTAVLILYVSLLDLADNQYIYADLGTVNVIAFYSNPLPTKCSS